MLLLKVCLISFCLIKSFEAPPVRIEQGNDPAAPHHQVPGDVQVDPNDWMNKLEYGNYLKEVMEVLENDQAFKDKVQNASADDITNGKVADFLDFASHNIRSKLDEIKRMEIDRLKVIAQMEMELPVEARKKITEDFGSHLNLDEHQQFLVDDLRKLIKKTDSDFRKYDELRKEEFKKYEMEKEAEYRAKLAKMTPEERAAEEKKHEESKKHHADHPKLHEPGTKAQLEEVWEETDGMDKDDFDLKTFFRLHDTNNDKAWDPAEVEAMFQKQLDEVYDKDDPEDDLIERIEEMNRMREEFFHKMDFNKDNIITWEEFSRESLTDEFQKDNGYKTLDELPETFDDLEMEQYIKEHFPETQTTESSLNIAHNQV